MRKKKEEKLNKFHAKAWALGKSPSIALGISLELRLYFTVYPSSCHKTDTILQTILKKDGEATIF